MGPPQSALPSSPFGQPSIQVEVGIQPSPFILVQILLLQHPVWHSSFLPQVSHKGTVPPEEVELLDALLLPVLDADEALLLLLLLPLPAPLDVDEAPLCPPTPLPLPLDMSAPVLDLEPPPDP